MSVRRAEKHLADKGLKVLGGIALNNSVGLFKLTAADAACEMGARCILKNTTHFTGDVMEKYTSGN